MVTEQIKQALKAGEIQGRYDVIVLLSSVALAMIGVVMVASSSVGVAERLHVESTYFLIRQVIPLLLGGIAALIIGRMELRFIERHGPLLLLFALLLLAMVHLPGISHETNGSRRWLSLGPLKFQVVEAVKLLLIIWLSSYLVRFRNQLQDTWWGLLKPLAVAAFMVVLLLLQPDFGSAMLVCAIVAGLIFIGGVRIRNLIAPALIALPLMAIVAIAEPYRVRRMTSFLDPWADPYDKGFQLVQALIAVGRGEWFGVGLGGSVQKLSFLPEAHTDFIFSVIAEETGFFGVLTVIGLFALLVGRAFWLGLKAVEVKRLFAAYCAFGVALWLGIQVIVSIGVNLGLLPTKGLTLPLISYGGSSVMMTCMAIGVLLRISYEVDRTQRQIALIRQEAGDVVPPHEGDLPEFGTSPTKGSTPVVPSPVTVSIPKAAPVPSRSGRIEPSLGVIG